MLLAKSQTGPNPSPIVKFILTRMPIFVTLTQQGLRYERKYQKIIFIPEMNQCSEKRSFLSG